jgi:hypothetical protein
MQAAGADAKVSADQRGHQIGVSLRVYTHSSVDVMLEAVDRGSEKADRPARTA